VTFSIFAGLLLIVSTATVVTWWRLARCPSTRTAMGGSRNWG
jgi:hypothetical protein